jgi:hypothetical protein
VAAGHTVSSSSFQNQFTEATTVSGALRQRLLGVLFLDVTGGYALTKYKSTVAGFSVGRTDHATFVNTRLSAQVLKRGSVGVFYQFTENDSNESPFAFSSNQVGFDLGYRF